MIHSHALLGVRQPDWRSAQLKRLWGLDPNGGAAVETFSGIVSKLNCSTFKEDRMSNVAQKETGHEHIAPGPVSVYVPLRHRAPHDLLLPPNAAAAQDPRPLSIPPPRQRLHFPLSELAGRLRPPRPLPRTGTSSRLGSRRSCG